ncbi:hypothetical protein KIH41_17060 [Litoribacter ruber]|uniref:hypothetical protein n=1 Tax=Litoribacter ruber TaxID=702568 RepID=UPI001BDAC2B8|nr:hypothetical protein [Litoribacter ruber]MBT0813000.1 hypothetical protein [Litoribacter ruber]
MRKSPIFIFFLLFVAFFQVGCENVSPEDLDDNAARDLRSARRPIGAAAREILSSQHFQSLQLEIQYMVGFEPTPGLVDNIREFLEELTNKPGGIDIYLTAIAPGRQESYSIADIRAIEDANRSSYNQGRKVGLYLLILDGYSAEDTGGSFTFGLVHRSNSIALFGRRMRENSDTVGRPSRSLLENTVTRHEIGHLMGLVNVGSDMVEPHEDPNHGGHCDNSSCLMYWAVETAGLLNVIDGGFIPPLDENCRNDIRANGGR